MKKIYTLFILFCSISFFGQISFTDTNFKAALLAANTSNSIAKDVNLNPMKIDTNIDGEISEAEALAVYHLDVSISNLITNNITNISEISYFSNLETLKCNNHQLTSLDVSMLANLKKLVANKNQLTSVVLPNPADPIISSNLEFLSLEHNFLTSINLSNLSLQKVFLSYNNFTTVNLESFVGVNSNLNSSNNYGIISISNNPNLSFINLPSYSNFDSVSDFYVLDIENTNISLSIFTTSNGVDAIPYPFAKAGRATQLNMLNTPMNEGFNNFQTTYTGTEQYFPPEFSNINSYYNHATVIFGNAIRTNAPTLYEHLENQNNNFSISYQSGEFAKYIVNNPNTISNIGIAVELKTSPNSIPTQAFPQGVDMVIVGNYTIAGTYGQTAGQNPLNEVVFITFVSNNVMESLEVSHYEHLIGLEFKDCSAIKNIYAKKENLMIFRLNNTPFLEKVCVFDAVYAANNFLQATPQTAGANFQYTGGPYCSTVYNGNVLRGNVFYNYNSTNYPINKNIKFTRTNSVNSYYSYSRNYELKAFGDTYTITPLGSLGANFTIDNTSKTQVVPDLFEPNLVNDFTITKTNTVHDLALTIYQGNPPVQNETFNLILNVQNHGTELDNCYVDVDYDNSKLTLTSSNPMFTVVDANTIRVNISNPIIPFNNYCYTIPFTVGIPPAVLVGDALVFNAQLTNQSFAADNNPNNNANTTAIVVGSYDPNDKICFEGDAITTDETDEFLTYRVRFQNDGNWYARNIVVTDVIDTKLDLDTFELIGSSHDVKIRSNPDNPRKLEFVFRNINLNWSSQSLEESQGYFIYKIKPNADAVEGSSIENTAAIYFDYNDPIITNTATTMVESTMGLNDNERIKINLLPNPCTNFVQIETEEKIEKVELYDALGRMVMTQLSANTTIDLTQILSGNYFVKIYLIDNRIVTKKIIKQ